MFPYQNSLRNSTINTTDYRLLNASKRSEIVAQASTHTNTHIGVF